MSKKVVTLGEIMLRLTPPNYRRIVQTDIFQIDYGGGEANVAVSLAHFGLNPIFVTKLPENSLGQAALNHLRRYGVGTEYIVRGGERLGVYFCENGASQRSSSIIYDRSHSSIAEALPREFDWKGIFSDAEWFHFTGITPALSDTATLIVKEALREASERNITVSCDLNYRSTLWSVEKAREVMTELMPYVDVCIANEEDSEKVFGIKSGSDIEGGKIDVKSYVGVAEKLVERFSFKYVGSHLRESYSASQNGWLVLIYNGKKFYHSDKYDIHIVDRVGAGDSFAAGVIYGLLNNMDLSTIVEFAAAASCLKHSVPGDFNMVSQEEVWQLATGSGSGRVRR